ncbi:MAG: arsenic transporter [Clostridiales bacterium]|nr:arsenic transporter [Clostridiales bacterium]
MLYAIVLFVAAYAMMLIFPKYRAQIAIGFGLLFVLTGMLPVSQAAGAIDWNVLFMIAGMMGLVQLFIDSRMPALLADLVMEHVHSIQMAAVALALFAGLISAFVDNVATVLMVAPVAMEICRKLDTNPVPFIISIAVSSNLQGAATLVGDTTAIMLGSYADMSFLDFFFYNGKPGMFFAVELGAAFSALILAWIFRKEKTRIPENGTRTEVTDCIPSLLLLSTVIFLILASFLPEKPVITNGLICMIMFVVGLIHHAAKHRPLDTMVEPIRAIDPETLGVLFGLFLIIGGITNMGIIDALADILVRLGSGNVFLLYTIVVWSSVLISAFVDNIPYVATMLPVISGIAVAMDIDPAVLYFGLLSGATLGGNCTPIGASANITGIGILRREGYEVRTTDFVRISVPFTLAAVIPAYIYLWVIFGC